MVIAHSLRACAPFLTLLILLVGCLVGCSSSATLQMRGVAPLNLNDAGESTPVDVRIYQLKNDAAFKRATFETSDAEGPRPASTEPATARGFAISANVVCGLISR